MKQGIKAINGEETTRISVLISHTLLTECKRLARTENISWFIRDAIQRRVNAMRGSHAPGTRIWDERFGWVLPLDTTRKGG